MKKYCSCCGRQFVKRKTFCDDECVSCELAVKDFGDKFICKYCARDLDENGLFTEERKD